MKHQNFSPSLLRLRKTAIRSLNHEYSARSQQTAGSVAEAEEAGGIVQGGRPAGGSAGQGRAEKAAVAPAVPRHSGERH